MNRFYEEGEAEEILRRALNQTDSGVIDRSRLLAMAAELGISEDAIAKAEAQMESERKADLGRKQEAQDRIAFKRHRRSRFWADFGSYVSVNAFLVAIWWFTGHGYFWPGWVLVCWGLSLAGDFFNAFFGMSEKDFERWKRKRDKRAALPAGGSDEIDKFLDEFVPAMPDAKIEQIKEVRERFGLDLTGAKEAVERYHARRNRVRP